jgi:malonyl-CoA O-methyltransferase
MPNTSIADCNKRRIAQQFSRAARTYDAGADVQLDIAFAALAHLQGKVKTGLDIGCGTGRISRQLADMCEELVAMDLAFGMLDFASHTPQITQSAKTDNQSITWLQADAECLPLANNSLNMIFSSMVLQWCNNQEKVMSEIARVMACNAHGVLAIMCDGSFNQLSDSWKNVDQQRHVNQFASAQSWKDAAITQGLKVTMHEKQYVTWHTNIRQLLSSIKSIGANVLLTSSKTKQQTSFDDKNSFNRHTLQHLETYYRKKFAKNMQLPLTYQVCFLQFNK